MSNLPTVREEQVVASPWDSREMVDTLKQTVCKGATDAQFRMFVEVCKATGLNPFLKEIWFVPAVGVMAGRDGYLRIANEHPQFDGMETRVERDEKGVPIKATCSVWRKDRGHAITCEAWFSEYRKNGNVWQTYPSAMISKVAEVLALKRSFAINGIVTEEEIGTEQERGSKEAPQEVAQRRIQQLKSIPAGSTVSPAQMADVDAGYEERHTALILEANAALDEVSPKAGSAVSDSALPVPFTEGGGNSEKSAPRNKGDISFKALKEIGTLKKVIRDVAGSDEKYYEVLKAAGVEHADELSLKAGREVYKALLAIPNAVKQDRELLLEVQTHALRIGPYAIQAMLDRHGLKSVEEVLNIPNGDTLDTLLRELRGTA